MSLIALKSAEIIARGLGEGVETCRRIVAKLKEDKTDTAEDDEIATNELEMGIKQMEIEIRALSQCEQSEDMVQKVGEYVSLKWDALKVLNEIKVRLTRAKRGLSTSARSEQTVNLTPIFTRLPEMEITKFNGNVLYWSEFWEQFSTNVDGRQDLNDALKLTYLKNFLEGEAKDTIGGLQNTAENYKIAVDKLRNRYAKPKRILDCHAALENLAPATSDIEQCRNVLNQIEIHLGILKSCGEDTNHNNFKITLMKKFPPEILHDLRLWMKTKEDHTVDDLRSYLQQEAPSVPLFKPKDKWEFPRHQLKVFSILGEGCFGQVWKCEARDIIEGEPGPKIVAVKTLKENAGERERSDLVSELQVMKMLEPHPNVVRLLGCCTEKDPIFVIMEYVVNGKLQSFLRSSRATRSYDNMHGKSDTLTSRQLTSFCYQVARGMEFLSNRGIIHRDLAARNVLVDTDHTCKVADFGFARDVVESHVYERKSEGRLPIRWMAPESLYDNVFSVKSDVWSFGVLIWEIVTLGSTPYPGLSAMEVMKRVKEGERLEKPEHCRRELYNIMYYCWEAEAIKRPDFTELVDLLGQLLLSETDYIELQRFPDHSYYNMVSLSGEKV